MSKKVDKSEECKEKTWGDPNIEILDRSEEVLDFDIDKLAEFLGWKFVKRPGPECHDDMVAFRSRKKYPNVGIVLIMKIGGTFDVIGGVAHSDKPEDWTSFRFRGVTKMRLLSTRSFNKKTRRRKIEKSADIWEIYENEDREVGVSFIKSNHLYCCFISGPRHWTKDF